MSMYSLFDYSASSKEPQANMSIDEAARSILEKAKQLADRLIKDRGNDKPPFSPSEYAHLLNMKIEKADLNNTSAVLLKLDDGYLIKVNQTHNLARQNFSSAHEIGHTLLSEIDPYIKNNIEYRTYNPQAARIAHQRAREHLCDIAATELLMPESVFKECLSDCGVSINSIEWLANTFKVSIQTTAIRIAEVSSKPCLALLWQPWPRNKPKGLRLVWCVGLGRSTMPVHKIVRYPSKLFEAYEYDNPVKSSKFFKVDKDTKRLPMESKGFGHSETRYVLSLAFLNR